MEILEADFKKLDSQLKATIKWLKPNVVKTGDLPQGWRLRGYDVAVLDERHANHFVKNCLSPEAKQCTIQPYLLLGSTYTVLVTAVYRNFQQDEIESICAERVIFTGNEITLVLGERHIIHFC